MSILIVEDDSAQAHYIEALLTRMSVQCRVATTIQDDADTVAAVQMLEQSGLIADSEQHVVEARLFNGESWWCASAKP